MHHVKSCINMYLQESAGKEITRAGTTLDVVNQTVGPCIDSLALRPKQCAFAQREVGPLHIKP